MAAIGDFAATLNTWRPRVSLRSVYHNGMLLLVMAAVAIPLLFLVLGSFSESNLPGSYSLSEFTLANYVNTWLSPDTYNLFANTAMFVIGSTVMGITIATILAWLVERTDFPGKIWIYAGIPIVLAMPGMLQAMAWVLLLSPRIGFVNQWIRDLFGLEGMLFNINSMGGMIFVEGLRLVPTAFLMMVPLLRTMDPALEEAASMSGASPARTIRRITMKLMAPGLVAVVIYQSMTALEVFEVPGIIGMPAGIYVFSTKIYSILSSVSFVPVFGEANALAMLYVLIAIVATMLYSKVIAKSERYCIVSGKGYQPRLQPLGKWRIPAVLFAFSIFFLAVIAPFIVLLYISFLPYLAAPSAAAFASMSLENYRHLFASEITGKVLWNTFALVMISSTATAALSFMIAMIVVRSRFWGKKLLDQMAFLPHAIPGIVLGLAFIWVFLQSDNLGIPLFGTVASLAIAFTVMFVSYGTRVMNAAVLQIHRDLEEAANMSGAPPLRVAMRIFLPLILPAFIGVWIWTCLHAVRIAGVPLLLNDGSSNEVLAVLMWHMWDQGYATGVGALGTLLMGAMMLLTLLLRYFGFKRQA